MRTNLKLLLFLLSALIIFGIYSVSPAFGQDTVNVAQRRAFLQKTTAEVSAIRNDADLNSKKLAEHYKLVKVQELTITVKADYKPSLDNFIKRNYNKGREDKQVKKLTSAECLGVFTDTNFANTSHKLVAGKQYKIVKYKIIDTVSSNICLTKVLDFLKLDGAIFTGPYGLTYLWENCPILFPDKNFNASYLSLDEDKNIPQMTDTYDRTYNIVSSMRYNEIGTGTWALLPINLHCTIFRAIAPQLEIYFIAFYEIT